MYQLEKDHNEEQFTSIPQSMYWAVVTMTTVGYGDVVPKTTGGKVLSALLILLGYSLIIVPTGFVSAEFIHRKPVHAITTEVCPACLAEGHDADAMFCKYCGHHLKDHSAPDLWGCAAARTIKRSLMRFLEGQQHIPAVPLRPLPCTG